MKSQPSVEDYLFTLYIKGGEITYTELLDILYRGKYDDEEYKYFIYVLENFCKKGYIEKTVDIENGNIIAVLTEHGKKMAENWAAILSYDKVLKYFQRKMPVSRASHYGKEHNEYSVSLFRTAHHVLEFQTCIEVY